MLQRLPTWSGFVLGAVVGAAAAVFGSLVSSNPLRAAALPVAIALFFFLLLDRRLLFLAILASRSAGDVFFDATRFSLLGYQIGVGGVINAIVILVVIVLVAEKPDALPRKALWAWAGFLVTALIGVVISPVKADAARIYLSVLSYFAVFTGAFVLVRSPADFRFCVRLVMWSSVIPVLYAIVELATGGGQTPDGLRLKATFGHPNIFAFYLVVVIAVTLYLWKSTHESFSSAARGALALYMAVLLALLLATQTRSGWIACFVLFAMYGLFVERRYLLYLLVVPLVAPFLPSVQDRLLDLAVGNDYVQYAKLNSFAWRRLIWETGLKWMHPDHYLLGYGLESFRHYSQVFFPLVNPTSAGSGAHNVYVQCLFELGILGLAAYVWLLGRLLLLVQPLRSLDPMAAFVATALTVAYLIVSFSDNLLAYLSFNWYFWLVVGAAVAATRGRTPTGPQAASAHV